ncbi:MAG: TonB-dependent receptor plug domain-containing protein, partial [Chitinophagaceae bacterium]
MSSDTFPARSLDEVVVTATRNERKISNVAVPVSVISRQTIERAGSLRLRDILQEQTGLFMTSGFGSGVQLQGLNPDYTLILLDGEPLIGRTAGVLDLNRITVGNIRKIEIVRGPSSSLYGSEALAGVINIITDQSFQRKTSGTLRYGTYNTADANFSFTDRWQGLGTSFFLNLYRTDGFSIRPFSVERQRLPVVRLTPQVRLNYTLSSKTSLSIQARYNREDIRNEITVQNNGQTVTSKGKEVNQDFNLAPVLVHQFNARLRTALRLYATRFTGNQQLNTSAGSNYDDLFRQSFYRAEQQWDYSPVKALSVVAGGGYILEAVNSSRYDSKFLQKRNDVKYGFLQAEWKPADQFTFISGLRYDANKQYASAWSPKIALQYVPAKNFRLQASVGRGFKAPDFRQLYLNFTNTAAGGYSVYGALEAQRIVALQQQSGLIQELTPYFEQLKELRPEFSTGYNLGYSWQVRSFLHWQVNLFRNDVTDLIESRQIAIRTDLSQIFSYINVKNVYTQGAETSVRLQVNPQWGVEAGYQLLLTADKQEKELLRQNNYYYTRNAE